MSSVPETNDPPRSGQTVTLTDCDREPIHIPGRIQPHGALLVLRESDLAVLQVSDNTEVVLKIPAQELLGGSVATLLLPEDVEALAAASQQDSLENNPLYLVTMEAGPDRVPCDAIVHRIQGLLVLELEPRRPEEATLDTYALVRQAVPLIQSARTLSDMFDAVAQQIRRLNGFDRVMVYQFDTDGHGSVVAESKREDMEPFFGLHYPASDIPVQARRLYTLNRLRLIADVGYRPSDIIPTVNPETQTVLDMSYCVLRSVSPIHIQYLKNMGVGASMSISIVQDGQLWGLIACHHDTPRFVPYDIRTACEFVGQVVSLQLSTKRDAADVAYQIRLKDVQAQLVAHMANEPVYQKGLVNHTPNLLDFIEAGGIAVSHGSEFLTLGQVPEPRFLTQLVDWLAGEAHEAVFATDQLARLYPDAGSVQQVVSGVLAIAVSPSQRQYLLWFRPEEVQTVNWAGNPNKAVEVLPNGSQRLSPRGSFALWKETVSGKSLPWKAVERLAAQELRQAIVGVILHRAEQLEALNAQLQRSNAELDAFTYIASHDLREPLRGIRNYAQFLREDHGDALSTDAQELIDTLLRLTHRMEMLIDSLLRYSRVGQQELVLHDTDLNQIVSETLDGLRPRLQAMGTEIRIPRHLPSATCDAVQVSEIFSNLLSNAIKYNDKEQKWVEVGFLEGNEARKTLATPGANEPPVIAGDVVPAVYYVRDNGIGIQEKHLDTIFRIFKRLHAREAFGGGTGAGLTIARKMAERHGGRLWATSVYGEGTTFYFTLQKADANEH